MLTRSLLTLTLCVGALQASADEVICESPPGARLEYEYTDVDGGLLVLRVSVPSIADGARFSILRFDYGRTRRTKLTTWLAAEESSEDKGRLYATLYLPKNHDKAVLMATYKYPNCVAQLTATFLRGKRVE